MAGTSPLRSYGALEWTIRFALLGSCPLGAALGLAIWAYHTTGWFGALWALGLAMWNATALTKNQV
jgi:hypothetical protein